MFLSIYGNTIEFENLSITLFWSNCFHGHVGISLLKTRRKTCPQTKPSLFPAQNYPLDTKNASSTTVAWKLCSETQRTQSFNKFQKEEFQRAMFLWTLKTEFWEHRPKFFRSSSKKHSFDQPSNTVFCSQTFHSDM